MTRSTVFFKLEFIFICKLARSHYGSLQKTLKSRESNKEVLGVRPVRVRVRKDNSAQNLNFIRKLVMNLKLFRGEPAISGFDWNFSPIHSSSPPFSTDVWFGPPWDFTPTSTWPWIGHPVSGLRHATIALFKLAFASAPDLQSLTSLHNVTRRSVLQKVRDRT